MFNLIYFEIDELLTVLAGTWCRQRRPWEHDVPASQGNTPLATIRASSQLFTSERPGALCLTSPIWSQSSAGVSWLFFSKPQPLKLGQKVLFSSAEGNTKILTPQTLAGVWTAIASDFAVLSVSLCLRYSVSQTSSVTALLAGCPTQLLACSLAWFCTKATAHHWNSAYHRLLPAHRGLKLRDDIYVCVWHTHERKGACMYCYRTNGSLIKTQDQVPHILEGLDPTME